MELFIYELTLQTFIRKYETMAFRKTATLIFSVKQAYYFMDEKALLKAVYILTNIQELLVHNLKD